MISGRDGVDHVALPALGRAGHQGIDAVSHEVSNGVERSLELAA